MSETLVGVRELKAHLSSHLRRVKTGGTVLITDRGEPIARLVPVRSSLEQSVWQMVEAGLASWSGEKPGSPAANRPRARGPKTVADLLLEDRD